MEDRVIETSIDKLIGFLREREKINISEAASFLGVTHKQLEPWLNTLEENGIIEIKYPVIGEPKIILKSSIPEKIDIKKLSTETKEKPEENEIEEKEMKFETPKISEKIEMKPEIRESEPKNITEKVEKLETEMRKLSHEVDVSMVKEELSEILLIIAGLKNIEKISFYLKEVLSLIHKMKEKNIWTSEDKDLVITMLKNVAENWEELGEEDIAKLFEGISKKVEIA